MSGIEIVEHGLYTAEIVSTERRPDGISNSTLRNLCHVVTTSVVPVRLGVLFGFRYRVDGFLPGESVELRRLTRFPGPVTPPTVGKPIGQFQDMIRVRIGDVSYVGYGFDHSWELQAGLWSFELWRGGRKFAQQDFAAVEGVVEPAPSTSNSNCFQLSSL